jgi:hypothetical protein
MSYPHRKWDAGSSFWVDVTIDGVEEYLHPKGDGISRTWHPNGQLASEYERKIGVTVGEPRQWHDNGVLASVIPYVGGKIHGVVRQWEKDGKLLGEHTVSEAYKSDFHRWLDERFYEWALRDFQREIAQDFPFLRRVGGFINRGERNSQLLREGPVGNTLGRRATFIRDNRELMRAVREELMLVFPGETPEKSNEELNFHATLHGFEVETIVYSGSSTWQLWYLPPASTSRFRARREPHFFDELARHRRANILVGDYRGYDNGGGKDSGRSLPTFHCGSRYISGRLGGSPIEGKLHIARIDKRGYEGDCTRRAESFAQANAHLPDGTLFWKRQSAVT